MSYIVSVQLGIMLVQGGKATVKEAALAGKVK
jgi:hypothetical protein